MTVTGNRFYWEAASPLWAYFLFLPLNILVNFHTTLILKDLCSVMFHLAKNKAFFFFYLIEIHGPSVILFPIFIQASFDFVIRSI